MGTRLCGRRQRKEAPKSEKKKPSRRVKKTRRQPTRLGRALRNRAQNKRREVALAAKVESTSSADEVQSSEEAATPSKRQRTKVYRLVRKRFLVYRRVAVCLESGAFWHNT